MDSGRVARRRPGAELHWVATDGEESNRTALRLVRSAARGREPLVTTTLLVVDDDPQVARFVADVARAAGYAVRVAGRADEILADESEPTLVLLDLNLPGTDGLGILRELAARGWRSTVHVFSGADPRVVRTATRLGEELGLRVGEPLSKPMRLAELRRVLDEAAAAQARAASGPARAEPAAGRAPAAPPPPTAEELARALATGELFVVFQPIVELATLEVRGAEALVRWRHPERGVVPPLLFVPLAERAGLVVDLTLEVLRQTLRFAASVADGDGSRLAFSVNLAPSALAERSLPERLGELLAESGVAPERLVLEVTESAAMEDRASVLEILSRLRLRGVELSIDDFGTGASSLERLDQLPLNELKIERAFVSQILRRAGAEAIVRSTVELGRRLGLRTVGEGIEDPRVLAWLREAGCELGQGFLFSKGLEPEPFRRWLAEWPERAPAVAASAPN
jgi:EAL domain-containing protein (putative c-di-GMP-specific phosphodiesterase class I)/CheY-like chemotaxis protein